MKEVKRIKNGGHAPVLVELAAGEGNMAAIPEPLEQPKPEQETPSYPNTLGK